MEVIAFWIGCVALAGTTADTPLATVFICSFTPAFQIFTSPSTAFDIVALGLRCKLFKLTLFNCFWAFFKLPAELYTFPFRVC